MIGTREERDRLRAQADTNLWDFNDPDRRTNALLASIAASLLRLGDILEGTTNDDD